jgi:Tfp pilus assembly protein PilF
MNVADEAFSVRLNEDCRLLPLGYTCSMADSKNRNVKAQAQVNRAFRLYEQSNYIEAERLCRDILAQDQFNSDAYYILGLMAWQLKRPDIAIEMFGTAIKLNALVPAYYIDLANVYKEQGKKDEAIMLYRHVLSVHPDSVQAAGNLALALTEIGHIDEAVQWHRIALGKAPNDPRLANNYGLALQAQGRYEEALKFFEKAVKLDPDYAQAQWNRGVALLLLGDFERGWPGAEWRWKMEEIELPGLTTPEWKGEDLNGKTILLHAEQGFGDSFQFVRYAPMVKALGAKIIFPCPPSLVGVFRGVGAIDVLLEDGAPMPVFDFHASLMSLPHVFKTTLETIPADVPYLPVLPEKAAAWASELRTLKGKKIGISWRGRPTHKNDLNRSMKAEQFAAMLRDCGASVVILQKDATDAEREILKAALDVYDPGDRLVDFSDTAAVIDNLDLVLTVDTAICHLSGGLGKKVWTLLPFAPDWRWLLNRPDDTPWYPTMRLFRQPTLRDWDSVVSKVRAELAAL